MFIDEAKIFVKGGDGGKGCSSTHREIYVPKGGPDGGNGGRGGSVILVGTNDLNTLIDFKKRVHVKAARGGHGSGNNKAGRDAGDTYLNVPLGTVVYEAGDGGRLIGEVLGEGHQLRVARGGRGGRGNAAFATPNYRVPRFCEKGEPGQERWIRLELRLIAHIGLVGLPNAGKSTLLSAVTRAKPKIADYPFTTLHPNLGVVEKSVGVRYIMADIPGLIQGASQGAGLGHKFLRHITRTRMMIHVIDLLETDPDNPLENYHVITDEMGEYSPSLLQRPVVVAANKTDVPGTEEAFFAMEKALQGLGVRCFPISAATGQGLEDLLAGVFEVMETLKDEPVPLTEGEPGDFVTVDEETENLRHFTIERVEDYFVVHGDIPERMVSMTFLDNDEAVLYLQLRLRRMGVEAELKRMGAREGDFVVIGDYEFNYFEEKEIQQGYCKTKDQVI
jgi:GTP-binding protein